MAPPRSLRRGLAALVLVLPLLCLPAKSDDAPAPAQALVTNVFFETDLRQAFSDVSAQTGVIIIPTEDVHGVITMELKDMPLEDALRLMCLPGGFVYREVSEGIWLVGSPAPESPAFRAMAEVEIVELEHLTGREIQARLPAMYERYCKFDELGLVVVTAPREILRETTQMIARLDRPLRQVMIEALVVETSAARTRDFYAKAQGRYVGGDTRTGVLTYTELAKNLLGEMLLLVERREATMKANPSVMAQEGRTAKVEVATEQYFSIVTGPVSYPYTTLQQIDATISLEITPLVAESTREITMKLSPTVSEVTGTGASQLPIITKRSVETTLRVRDGDVIAVGGLLEAVEVTTRRKIPILGDIPLLGELFRSSERHHHMREVVIFIVPHIVEADGSFRGARILEQLDTERTGAKPGTDAPPPSRSRSTRSVSEAFGVRSGP